MPRQRLTIGTFGDISTRQMPNGRYKARTRWSHLTVTFHTIHGSKGLEADYIVMPRVVKG